MNRFFDIDGDVSTELAPWKLQQQGQRVKTALFLLQVPVRFRSDIAGGVIVVPQNYLSDLASIPQFAWSIFMACDDPRIELGGWVHDLLYQNHGVVTLESGAQTKLSRKDADTILTREAMPDLFGDRVSMRRGLSSLAPVRQKLAGRFVLGTLHLIFFAAFAPGCLGGLHRLKILLAKPRWFSDAMARYVHWNLHRHRHAVQKRSSG
jgi:Protein of unknown function (DUF1353)